MESNRNLGRGIIGIVLILIGVAFIGRTLDFFPHRIMHYIFTWEMILIVMGVIFISTRENKTTGWILLIIGLVFWVPEFVDIPYGVRRLFWPSLFIIVGVVIILRSVGHKRPNIDTKSADYIDDIAILGGGDKVITSDNFKGGKITAIFGGSKIDLRKAKLAPGQNVIDVFCMFGGTTIIVPESWNVKHDVISVLGGFSHKRNSHSDATIDIGKELVVRGFAMFGGGEIKHY
jgi:predicted membrane protein